MVISGSFYGAKSSNLLWLYNRIIKELMLTLLVLMLIPLTLSLAFQVLCVFVLKKSSPCITWADQLLFPPFLFFMEKDTP